MSQPRQNRTIPAAKSKEKGEKKSKRRQNKRKNKGSGSTLEGGKGKGKAIIDAPTVNSATISSHFAQSSTSVSINRSNAPAQATKQQDTANDKGKGAGASYSKPNAANTSQPNPASFAPKTHPAGNKRDQNQRPAAVRAVIDPHLFSIAQKLPIDILGIITLERSRDKWIAPLAISQVCQLWRTAALATPAAWACIQIDPHNPPGPKFLDLWLSRCGALTCQLSFPPWGTFSSLKVACSRAELLKGLSIFHSTQVLTGSFPNLEELRVSGYLPKAPRKWKGPSGSGSEYKIVDSRGPSLLQVSRFPSLRVLHLHSLSNMVMTAMARQGLPPLEELHIHATFSSWEDIVSQCALFLVSLAIRYDHNNVNTAGPKKLHSVTLPKLECLSIVIECVRVNNHRLTTFQTPSLRTYHEKQVSSDPLQSPIHQDTRAVTTAIFVGANRVDWTKLPSLTHMTLQAGDLYCRNLCDSLGKEPMQASRLSEIQWVTDYSAQMKIMKQSLEKRRRVTGKTCFTYLPGACGSNTGDIFNEGGEHVRRNTFESDYSDDNDDYFHRRYGSYGDGWDFNPSGPGSGCPAGIDSDGPYDEFGRPWYD
ncbi:hypothetical protein FRC17_011301 [Serendipita sp. 399]|nr:hypothetical protein FRC17_011301 [Serendipita sp. 399]